MKWRTWKKSYCPRCSSKLKCELSDKTYWDKRLKYYATGAMYSQSKLWDLRYRLDATTEDHKPYQACPVMMRIYSYRLNYDKGELRRTVTRLTEKIQGHSKDLNDLKSWIKSKTGRSKEKACTIK